ncbi:glutamate--cysteine ligase [Corynebacterium sp.]|uniref:glutamate--cysteine ligase n=1 Tax=Corynebacterium sp. TaxID=1720 RepID=UPI0026DB2247|nr:glutamate--cysteine ligase [Corynebacterium sp.]MDO4610723.1 glutamate--cysteine ligase [Corynebacterium sp.]
MTENFAGSPRPTLGVEWELVFVDRTTRDTVPCAAEALELIAKDEPDHGIQREFLANTVELVTDVCDDVPQAVADLEGRLRAVRGAADVLGVDLWSSGSHPFSRGTDQIVGPKPAHQEILNRTQWWGRQMIIWGIHVHVGVSSADKVWPIINALQVQLPHMLAVSASSPAWNGEDMGYASNRSLLYQQLPTAGLPPAIRTWDEWRSYMTDQMRSGVIDHTKSMHLDIRPASKYGTIEVRVADSVSNMRELAGLVALTHSLVVHYDRMLERGEELPSIQPWHTAENKWRAARYGMEALVIVDRDTNERWIRDDLADLVTTLRPVAASLNCGSELEIIGEIMDHGAGYERQRRAAAAAGAAPALTTEDEVRAIEERLGGSPWTAAVDLAVREMAAGRPLGA